MHNYRIFSWPCIKPNTARDVKLALPKRGVWLALLWLTLAQVCAAEDLPPPPSSNPSPDSSPLPDIIAKTYDLSVVKRSNSNKIYILNDKSDGIPAEGRMLLLKKDEEPIMALRVLKLYPDKKEIAAKWLRKYGEHHILENNDAFLAIEKVSDIIPPPPTPQDNADIKELEGQGSKASAVIPPPPPLPVTPATASAAPAVVDNPPPPPDGAKPAAATALPSDPDLDGGTPPANGDESDGKAAALLDSPSEKDKEDQEDETALSVEEVKEMDPFRHWLTAGFGWVRNSNNPSVGGSYLFSAGNLRYGITIAKRVMLDQKYAQDSFVLEAGFMLYKGLNYVTTGDAYTVVTGLAELRYNVMFGTGFGLFIYTSFLQSFVLSTVSATAAAVAALNSTQIGAGGGILFQIGPSWYTRVDIGFDQMNLNLVLRF
jgi:hypothetical protein